MSDIPMTADAIGFLAFGVRSHSADDQPVATKAIGQEDPLVERPDPDRFVKISGGKGFTVVPTVKRFDRVMAGEILGRVAVVAGRRGFMRRPVPVVEMAPHDVAVQAGFRIVLQIGRPLGEKEREPA
jgi:hypothetical protein